MTRRRSEVGSVAHVQPVREQHYHGVVRCALGWACWKTYVGRPEVDWTRSDAMTVLGNGLSVSRYEDALPVREAHLAMLRRVGASEDSMLIVQSNLASTYQMLRRVERGLKMYPEMHTPGA